MKKIHHVVDVDAPAERVWWALTETDGLTGWWSTVLDSSGAAVGLRQAWTFAGDFNPVMEVTENVERSRLAWHCTGGHGNWQDNDFTFELDPLEDGRTRLR